MTMLSEDRSKRRQQIRNGVITGLIAFPLLGIFLWQFLSEGNHLKWKIIKQEEDEYARMVKVSVSLERKTTLDVLTDISGEIKDDAAYDRVFIFFIIQGRENESGAWASAEFNPNLEVKIFGTSALEDAVMLSAAKRFNDHVIGKWWWDSPFSERVFVLYKTDSLRIKYFLKDGSNYEEAVVLEKNDIKYRIDYLDPSHSEYLMMEPNGNLGLYSPDGKFGEATVL